MSTDNSSGADGVEDVAACLAAGRSPRPHGPYRIQVGDAGLSFQDVRIEDPVPTGRQIIGAVKARPVEEHLVFQMLSDGELEELRLDETTDLRTKGVERFLVFPGAASYRFELDGRVLEWGACAISGLVLKRLAGVDPQSYRVWLEVRGAADRPIRDNELVPLDGAGLERFFTGIEQSTEGTA